MSTGNVGLVSRVAQQDALRAALGRARAGSAEVVVLEGAEGSGRRSLVNEVVEAAAAGDRPALVIRARFAEGEDSLRVLLRLYAGLYVGAARTPELKERLKAASEARLADAALAENDPLRLWLKAFMEGLEKDLPEADSPTFQVTVPRASPYLGLQRILDVLSDQALLVFELGDAQHVMSFAFWTLLTSLVASARRDGRAALFALWTPPAPQGTELDAVARSSQISTTLAELPGGYERIEVGPLDAAGVAALVAARHPGLSMAPGILDQLGTLSGGMPGAVVGILDRLVEQSRLSQGADGQWRLELGAPTLSLESLLPALPEGDEAKLRRALQVAALEGMVFTSSVVGDTLDLKKDAIDDLLDELDDQIEEVVFNEGLGSWIYRFKAPLYQRAALAPLSALALKEQARQLATTLESRYVGRAREYAAKAARLWQEAGEPQRALRMVGLATSMERPEVLQMGFEIFHVDTATTFPRPIVRGLLLSLLEKLAAGGNPAVGLQVVERMEAWAAGPDADELGPWASQYRARFAMRQGDIATAHTHAEESRKGFARLNNNLKQGESLALLAQIELTRGEVGKALEDSKRALKLTEFAPVQAQARFTLGLVLKMRGELQPAVEELRQALDLSGRTGMLPLHADVGLNLSETLLMGNNPAGAVNLLQQLLNFTRQNKMQPRERGVLSLLGKANAALQDYTTATTFASEALQHARQMKNRLAEASDLFDLGLYSYLRKSFDEAQIYLKEAEHAARELNHAPLLTEIYFHQGLIASGQKDLGAARQAYLQAEAACRQIGHPRRLANILFNLGALYLHGDELDKARRYLDEAQPLVEQYGSDADKKGLRRALSQLDDRLN